MSQNKDTRFGRGESAPTRSLGERASENSFQGRRFPGRSSRAEEESGTRTNWRRGSGGESGGDRRDFGSSFKGYSSSRGDGSGGGGGGDAMSNRPRIQLAKRTETTGSTVPRDDAAGKAKSNNPFGDATAADTASRLEALEIKAKEQKTHDGAEQHSRYKDGEEKVSAKEEKARGDVEGDGTGDAEIKQNGGDDVVADGMKDRRGRRDRNQRRNDEPRVMNSRAALLGEAAPTGGSGMSERHQQDRDRERDHGRSYRRGPAPVVSERFAKLASEDREQNQQQQHHQRDERRMGRRGGERGPPPMVQNSRFAKAAEEDADYVPASQRQSMGYRERGEEGEERRTERRGEERGPPPMVQNSRFAKAAEEDADYVPPSQRQSMGHRERGDGGFGPGGDRREKERGPPPVQNSRFAKAVEEDADYVPPSQRQSLGHRERGEGGFGPGGDRDHGHDMDPRGPPPMVQNSRFAAAAAELEKEREMEMKEREERRMMRGPPRDRMDLAPPPIPTNSRFAAAAADYEVEKEREMRERDERRAERQRQYEDRQQGGEGRYGENRNRPLGGRFGGRMDRGSAAEDPFPPLEKTRTTFIKPELPAHLQPKKPEEPVLPPVEAPLALPGEDEEAAKARIEKKKREEEERRLAEQKAAEEAAAKKAAEEAAAAEKARKAAEMESDLLNVFVNSGKSGEELKVWCQEQGAILPSVEKLVYHLLITTQKDDPNPQCPWAEPTKYGAALCSLVQDNVVGMMEILFAIQRFCKDIGFPKIGNEGLIQAMFRNMYKYDLADDEAFSAWKEDESPEREDGKGKSIIQTMDWFNWLEEEEEEESEEEYDE